MDTSKRKLIKLGAAAGGVSLFCSPFSTLSCLATELPLPYGITQSSCTACGLCKSACPISAIYQNLGTMRYNINCEQCIGCSACQKSCPVNAINRSCYAVEMYGTLAL